MEGHSFACILHYSSIADPFQHWQKGQLRQTNSACGIFACFKHC